MNPILKLALIISFETMKFNSSLICLLITFNAYSLSQDGPPPYFDDRNLDNNIKIKAELISRYGNPKKYTVFGKVYHVRRNIHEFIQTGTASWYGTQFHGKKTSSGELFNLHAISGAHKELPIPCFVKVTNLKNNRSIVVRINDRGPFHKDRILDLSYAGAKKLGYHHQGTTQVKLELISPPIENNKTYIEVGTFKSDLTAEELAKTIESHFGQRPLSSIITLNKQTYIRLSMGPYPLKTDIKPMLAKLKKLKIEYTIKYF